MPLRIIAAPPAVERLPANTEVAAGERGISTVALIVIHPLKPLPCGPAQNGLSLGISARAFAQAVFCRCAWLQRREAYSSWVNREGKIIEGQR